MNWKLFSEISSAIIGGLIAVPLAMTTVRSFIDGKAPAWIPSDVAGAEALAAKEGWLHRSLVAFDIGFNVIVLRGQPDETISTHAWRAGTEGKLWGKWVTDWLGWFQPNHGQRAAAGDLQRATMRVLMLKKALGVD